jgi:hypothetical protein
MKKQFNLKSPIKGNNGKTYWQPIGRAYLNDDGTLGISLNALPLPDEKGQVRMVGFEPEPRQEAAPAAGQGQGADGHDEAWAA